MRVLILHDRPAPDGGADDQDTIVQVRTVRAALRELGHQASAAPFSPHPPDLAAALDAARPDAVFNLVEGNGRGGHTIHHAPALLEDAGIPFTGAGAEAMALSSNKLFAKAVLTAHDVATPPWRTGCGADAPADTGRWIVKSVWEHASIGLDEDCVLDAPGAAALRAALARCAPAMGGECFAEGYVAGREFNIALLEDAAGPRLLPSAEMRFEGDWGGRPRIVGYKAKWDETAPEYAATRRSFAFGAADGALLAALGDAALACWHAFGLGGYARVDFRVGPDGQPLVIDVNANPCLSPDGGFRAALERGGTPLPDAVEAILRAALAREASAAGSRAA